MEGWIAWTGGWMAFWEGGHSAHSVLSSRHASPPPADRSRLQRLDDAFAL